MQPQTQAQSAPQAQPQPPPALSVQAGSGGSRDSQSVLERLTNRYAYDPQTAHRRFAFYQRLLSFSEQKGTNMITNHPTVSKQPVDLHDLYQAVQDRGGFEMVSKRKGGEKGGWRELCEVFQVPSSNSAAGQLKRQYDKYLFDFECMHERQGQDPEPIRKALEPKKKKKRPAQAASPMEQQPPQQPAPAQQPPVMGQGPPQWSQQNGPGQAPTAYPPPPPPSGAYPSPPGQAPPPRLLSPSQPQVSTASAQQPPPSQQAHAQPPQPPPLSSPASTASTPNGPPKPGPGSATPPTNEVVARDPFDDNGPSASSSARLSQQTPNNPSQPHPYYSQSPYRPPYPGYPYTQPGYPPRYPGVYGQPGPGAAYQRPPPPPQQQPPPATSTPDSNSAATPPYVHPQPPPSFPTSSASSTTPSAYQPAAPPQPYPQAVQYVGPPSQTPIYRAPGSGGAGGAGGMRIPAPPNRLLAPTPTRSSVIFPPGSVELTHVTNRKRRKVTHRDLGKVEAWRLVMGLKSGLAAEQTWALNCLNILLFDDAVSGLFALKTLPGLLEVLVEHFRRSLLQIFPEEDFGRLEVEAPTPANPSAAPTPSRDSSPHTAPPCPTTFHIVEEGDVAAPKASRSGENGRLNYNRETRTGRPVRLIRAGKRRKGLMGTEEGILTSDVWEEGGGLGTEHLALKWAPHSPVLRFHRGEAKREEEAPPTKLLKEEIKEEAKEEKRREELPPFFFRDGWREETESWELTSAEIARPPTGPLRWERSEWRQRALDLVLAVSNVIRGLVGVSGNEAEMAKHPGLLSLLGPCLALKHRHLAPRAKFSRPPSTGEARGAEAEAEKAESEETLAQEAWKAEAAAQLREDAMVVLCSLSAHLDLHAQEESVARPIVEALLHWTVCKSPEAVDPLPPGILSPIRYSLESLCKLSVLERNVDLILSTPPWARTGALLGVLGGKLSMGEEIPVREFCLVVLAALCHASEAVCVMAAQTTPAIAHLVAFLEQADGLMHQVVSTQGMNSLRENPEQMGTSVGMLRRAAGVLAALARVPACRPKFQRHQQRLLQFTMSQLMDSRVAAIVAETLHLLQKPLPEDALLWSPADCLPPRRPDPASSSPAPTSPSNSPATTAQDDAASRGSLPKQPPSTPTPDPAHEEEDSIQAPPTPKAAKLTNGVTSGDCSKACPPIPIQAATNKVSV